MSFILDALKKSENQRQQQADAEFSSVPVSSAPPPAPRWLWALGALLAINIVVIGGLLFRDPPAAATGETGREIQATASTNPDFAARVETARRQLPDPVTEGPPPASSPAPASTAVAAQTDTVAVTPPRSAPAAAVPAQSSTVTLPSLDELRASGSLTLPELHLDLHVYSEVPGRGFVSINMKKYKQNERLDEGPRVQEITREGVILDYQGTEFVLIQ